MKNILSTSLVVAVFLTWGDIAPSQAYPHTRLTSAVDDLFEQWDKGDSPGAAVGIFKDGRILYARGYGVANLDYAIPMTPHTVVRIGSISKQFVAMCIALLAEQEQLTFDDDIRTYLPEMPDYGEPITINHLLHHTSGVHEYLDLVGLIGKPEGSVYGYSPREVLGLLSRLEELDFRPGERFSYSNSGYFLLAEVVSRVSGMKTSAFAKQHIFDPLGMKNTRFHDDPNAIIQNRGFGYSPVEGGGYRLDILRSEVIGDLGVITTVEDFLHWDRNLQRNRLGNGTQDLIEAMLSRGRLDNGDELSYALGLEIGTYRGLRTISHGGSAVGYVAEYIQYPEHRFSIVILSNLSTLGPGRLARGIADLYLADYLTTVSPTPTRRQRARVTRPELVAVSASELRAYAGNFYSRELDIVYALEVRDGVLVLELREESSALVPYGADRFGWRRRTLQFSKEADEAFNGFALSLGPERSLRFRRVKSPIPGLRL